MRTVGQVHEREQVGGAGLALGARTMAQRGHDVLERGQVREERVLLEHEPDGTVVWRQVDAVRGVEPGLAIDADPAVTRCVQAGNRPENRRLAAAGRAEDRQHVAGSAGEVDGEPDRAVLVSRDLQAAVSHGGSHAGRARW